MRRCLLLAFCGFICVTADVCQVIKSRQTEVYYRCGPIWIGASCTGYSTVYYHERQCCDGWRSGSGGLSCEKAICGGKVDPGACSKHFSNSHIISLGNIIYSSEGECKKPDQCTCTTDGFYSASSYCNICSAISNCDHELCTNSHDQTCARCEGVVFERSGERAYVSSTNKRQCNKACSWRSDSTRCYPGTCEDEVATNCKCSSGFSGKHCERIDQMPDFKYNEIRLTAENGEFKEAPGNINDVLPQPAVWTNIINPVSIQSNFKSIFIQPNPGRHAYVKDYKVGITGGLIQIKRVKSKDEIKHSYTCPQQVYNRQNPHQGLFECKNILTDLRMFQLPFNHLESLEVMMTTSNGGFVKIENMETDIKETFYFNGASRSNTFVIKFDDVNPFHCKPVTGCVKNMLTDIDVTKKPRHIISWDGWTDTDSGIEKYGYQVFVLKVKENILEEGERIFGTDTFYKNGTINFTVPGVYSLILSVYDHAGNHQSARRIIIFDDSSDVTTTHASSLTVISAEPASSYSWQQNLNDVIIDWKDRYINERHHAHRYLAGVKDYPDITSEYDDNHGLRTTNPYNNIQGIIRFETYYTIDAEGGSTINQPTDTDFTATGNLNQYASLTPSLKDGDTLRYFIRAYDILQQYKEESVTVHFDSSPPIIENLWLTKGDMLKIAVHSSQNLNDLTIEWTAFDYHSGLHTVRWQIYDNFTNDVIMHGSQYIPVQGETKTLQQCELKYDVYPRGHNCYCTPAMGCFHKHFQVKPSLTNTEGEGLLHSKNKGTHDHDYFIQIDVVNKAKLNSSLTMKITIDTSPPHEETVSGCKYG